MLDHASPRPGFLMVFAVPALMPLAYALGQVSGHPNLCAFLPIAVLDGLLPVADHLLGTDPRNPPPGPARDEHVHPFYEFVALACLPVYAALLGWSAWVVLVEEAFTTLGALGWMVSLGYVGGITAINAAHELIHRRSRVLRTAGGLLLALVSYAGFKIEHVRGHHVHVSTPEDASSAPRSMSLYRFLPRAVWHNSLNAWRLEAGRLKSLGLSPWSPRNEMLAWSAVTVGIAAGFTILFGSNGLAFFVGQSLFAILSLETINYVEHYGLRRRRLPGGRYERPNPTHSWNSCHRLSNLMLFNLARHSDHHAAPTRPYPLLRHHHDSPQLPAGYGAMFVLAAIPPLWFRIMNPRVDAYENARVADDAMGVGQTAASAALSSSAPSP